MPVIFNLPKPIFIAKNNGAKKAYERVEVCCPASFTKPFQFGWFPYRKLLYLLFIYDSHENCKWFEDEFLNAQSDAKKNNGHAKSIPNIFQFIEVHAYLLIHSANPQSRRVMIIVFAKVVRPFCLCMFYEMIITYY